MIWLTVLACGRVDPELASQRAALDAWTRGTALLDAGDPAGAATEFERARKARTGDLLLTAWHAKALADQGRLDEAIAMLDGILALEPDFGEARYNRAAWLARAGHPEQAAADLQLALDADVRRPREVLADPDFQRWLDHPAFSFLPRAALSVAEEAPPGPVFWGSEASFRLRVAGAGDDPVRVSGRITGPVDVGPVLEDVRWSTDGPVHDVTWQLRATGPGTATIGPLVVSSPHASTELSPVQFQCTAPPGKVAPEEEPGPLWVPSGLAGAWAIPSAHRAEGRIWVKALIGDRIETTPTLGDVSGRLELREGGQTQFVAQGWLDPGGAVSVRVVRAGAVVWEGAPE